MNNYLFKDKVLGNYNFLLDNQTFLPTQTSNCIIHAALKVLDKPSSVLDLGCGCGIVAILVAKHSTYEMNLSASDLSETVIDVVNKNAKEYGVTIDVRKSDIFNAWEQEKFDLIINDISGIAEEVALISPWFKNISCEAGEGGNLLVDSVIDNAHKYLNKDGKLVFPVISFSNKEAILGKAKSTYMNVDLVERQEWPAPQEMLENIELLEKLKIKGLIDYELKFGKIIGYTEIYCAY
jgi:cyclopropane fatty-acyl-phospholipid synthase-like methyltransferase